MPDEPDRLKAIASRNARGAKREKPRPRGENPSPAVPTAQDRLNRIIDRNKRGGYGEGAWFKTVLLAIVVALIVLYCVTDLGKPAAPPPEPQGPPEADGILLQQVPSKPPHPGSGSATH